jgi:hypothetical protein
VKRDELRVGRAYVFQRKRTGNEKEKVILHTKTHTRGVLVQRGTEVFTADLSELKGPYYIGGKRQV